MATTHAARKTARRTHASPSTASSGKAEKWRRKAIVTASQARDNFAEIFNQVKYTGARVVVGRRGRDRNAVAVVSMADLRVLEELENRRDLRDALEAIKANGDEPEIPWEQVKKKLAL